MWFLDKTLKYMPQWEANKMYQKYQIPLFFTDLKLWSRLPKTEERYAKLD